MPDLHFDWPEISVGVAAYPHGPTGCTVIRFPDMSRCAVDIRGGSPAVIGLYPAVDAICLAGGSAYGLEAATGVSAAILAEREGRTGWTDIALVSGAIVFDFGMRANAVYPDHALGRAAYAARRPGVFPIGRHGGGSASSAGKGFRPRLAGEFSGQGAAFRQVGALKVAFFTVLNPLGALVDRGGRVVLGNLAPDGTRIHPADALSDGMATPPAGGNTTISVLAVNQRLPHLLLQQLGRQVHASMARAIQPFHAMADGDVLFTVTTEAEDAPGSTPFATATLASEVAWDAVLSVVAQV